MTLKGIVSNTDMRCSHPGLIEAAKKAGMPWGKMKKGDIVAFINASRDRIKVLVFTKEQDTYGVMGYYRSPHGRVMPEAIQKIPLAFGAGEFNMDRATKAALEELLAKKVSKKLEEV